MLTELVVVTPIAILVLMPSVPLLFLHTYLAIGESKLPHLYLEQLAHVSGVNLLTVPTLVPNPKIQDGVRKQKVVWWHL